MLMPWATEIEAAVLTDEQLEALIGECKAEIQPLLDDFDALGDYRTEQLCDYERQLHRLEFLKKMRGWMANPEAVSLEEFKEALPTIVAFVYPKDPWDH